MSDEVIEANIAVHTAMANSYNESEPHYREENREKVKAVLTSLIPKNAKKLLDVGCGTGFIIDMAKPLFEEIHGVDVTQAMLDRVDCSGGNVTLHKAQAEALPFDDNYFDMVSSYAFIHHVFDYEKVLEEVYRVLRPGGVVYIDLEPNKFFWQAMVDLEKSGKPVETLDAIVSREIGAVLHTGDQVEKDFGIDKNVFDNAEYTKTIMGGIDPDAFSEQMSKLGFSQCEVTYQWYMGQGAVMHNQSFEDAAVVENYLQRALPLSRHMFKYLRFVLTK